MPYFWSEQLGHRLQHVGHAGPAARVVHRAGGDGWSVGWFEGDRLLALLAVDRPRDLAQGRRRIGDVLDAARFADPELPLKVV